MYPKRIVFVIWYDQTTVGVVQAVQSALAASGPCEVFVRAVKIGKIKTPWDSIIGWMPRTKITFCPNGSKREAWDIGAKAAQAEKPDYIVLCDPTFSAGRGWLNGLPESNYFRFFVPYGNEYGDETAGSGYEQLKTNVGGSVLVLPDLAVSAINGLPHWLHTYRIDSFIFDRLAMLGYTAHKLTGAFVETTALPQTDEQMAARMDADADYDVWRKTQGQDYQSIIAKNDDDAQFYTDL